MTSASVFTRDLLLAVNGVWVKEVRARRCERVPEGVQDLTAVLKSAAGRDSAEGSVSTLSVDMRISKHDADGVLQTRRPLWHAADFEETLAAVVRESHQRIADSLRGLYGRAADIVYWGGDDLFVGITLEMLIEDPADPERAITIVSLPDTPAITDPRFQSVDAVALGAFPGLDFSREPGRNGNSGGEEPQVTEIEAGEEIELVVTASGPLFEEESEGGT